jgi:hypothetical protein
MLEETKKFISEPNFGLLTMASLIKPVTNLCMLLKRNYVKNQLIDYHHETYLFYTVQLYVSWLTFYPPLDTF